MAYAVATDVSVRLGTTPDDALNALITTRLDDAERMIKRRFVQVGRDLDADVTDHVLDVDDVIQVEAEAVLRLARNPEGFQSEADGSYTYMLMQSVASGVLEILPTEWQILGVAQRGMFVIVPTPVVGT